MFVQSNKNCPPYSIRVGSLYAISHAGCGCPPIWLPNVVIIAPRDEAGL